MLEAKDDDDNEEVANCRQQENNRVERKDYQFWWLVKVIKCTDHCRSVVIRWNCTEAINHHRSIFEKLTLQCMAHILGDDFLPPPESGSSTSSCLKALIKIHFWAAAAAVLWSLVYKNRVFSKSRRLCCKLATRAKYMIWISYEGEAGTEGITRQACFVVAFRLRHLWLVGARNGGMTWKDWV